MGCCQSQDQEHEKNIEDKIHGRQGKVISQDNDREQNSDTYEKDYEKNQVAKQQKAINSQQGISSSTKEQTNGSTANEKNTAVSKQNSKHSSSITDIPQKVEKQSQPNGVNPISFATQKSDQKQNVSEDFKIQKNMVRISTQDILDSYTIGKVIGEGGFGTVCLVRHKTTQIDRAMKMIPKKKLNKSDEDKLFEELAILRQIDHPCIVKVFEHFQDEKYHYLISEYCTGGELFERIKDVSPFTEKVAAGYMKQILSAISYCHINNIVHRDLKPENILFDSKATNSNLKVIDFGASTKFDHNEKLTKRIGTPFYVAPEILTKKPYDEKCDVWSLGVIMYILLCGYPPFWGQTDQEIYEKVKKGKFEFYDEDWADRSSDAKDLISKMLQYDPKDRISATEAYAHPWILSNVHVEPLDDKMMKKLSQFAAKNKLRIAILNLMANQVLNTQDKIELVKHFESLDTNGDGMLSKEELIEGYTKLLGDQLKAKQTVENVFNDLDLDGSGKVEFSEFLVACLQKEKVLTKDRIEKAFKLIDTDGNGQITKKELEEMMGGLPLNEKVWESLLKDCDVNQDGQISLTEFLDLLLNAKELFNL
ncbi:calcium-dependent kinase (macronuclear) [Tetrahymena thermophila SB210]|uniref:Calcium-dependent protein kinase 1 n=1 Tax=Tetrahymena thermophila (strain SB210) TaxID=312017 RepID=Q248B0_TETTS|nr:calcium-dependent kinase [Tetrahymena thermophila SB210]EAS04135.3 calcium-dependent kinase [Tetrahymena thermophila SB210]|eukprot:XP_001024380.3 calcium-dependent kinase [Tetrahymena thermophila SB210]